MSAWANRTSQDAPLLDRVVSRVAITDPTHPLFGQTLPVVPKPSSKGPAFLLVRLPGGEQRSILRAATNPDRQAAGEAVPKTLLPVSVRTLLALAHQVGRFKQAAEESSDETRSDFPPVPHDSPGPAGRPARDGTARSVAAPGSVAPPATGAALGRADPASAADRRSPAAGDFP
jgi:hypothetical protein